MAREALSARYDGEALGVDEAALCEWLSAFIGGGSDLDVPVAELPRMYAQIGAPPGVTDLVLVTDARCRIGADLRDRFLVWKQLARARVIALVVGVIIIAAVPWFSTGFL